MIQSLLQRRVKAITLTYSMQTRAKRGEKVMLMSVLGKTSIRGLLNDMEYILYVQQNMK
jgi:hypothetical protein